MSANEGTWRHDLAPAGPIGRLDRAFVLVRAGGLGLAARAWAAGLPLALLAIALWYVERVEGVRALRPVFAIALALAWWARAVALGRVARAHARRSWPGAPIPEGAGRVVDVARTAGWTGIGLWCWSWVLVVGALAGPIGLALVLPVLAIRGAIAPSWLARSACTNDAGLSAVRASIADSSGQRAAGLVAELAMIVGALALFVDLAGALALALLLGRSFLGLDLALLDSFLSMRNTLVLIALASVSLLLLEPLRAALSAVTWIDARVRHEALDLRIAVDRAVGGTARRSARTAAAALVLLVVLTASGAHAQVPPQAFPPPSSQVLPTPLPPQQSPPAPPQAFPPPPLPPGFAPEPEPGAPPPIVDSLPPPTPPSVDPLTTPPPAALAPALSAPPPSTPPDPRDATTASDAAEILARPEFRELEDTRGRGLRESIERILEWLFRHRDPIEVPPPTPMPAFALPGPLVFLGLALALVGLIALVLVITRPLRRAPGASATAPSGAKNTAEIDPRERAPTEWVDDAGRLAAQGRFREAMRALYLATLVALDRRRLIRFDRTRTNGHYLRQMPHSDVRADFRDFTRHFDRTWYGREDATEHDYRTCRALADRIVADRTVDAGAASAEAPR